MVLHVDLMITHVDEVGNPGDVLRSVRFCTSGVGNCVDVTQEVEIQIRMHKQLEVGFESRRLRSRE